MSVSQKSQVMLLAGLLLTSVASSNPSHNRHVPRPTSGLYAVADTVTITSATDLVRAIVASNYRIRSAQTLAEATSNKRDYAGVYPDPTFMISRQPFPAMTAMGKPVLELGVEQMIPYPGKPALMRNMADIETVMGFDNSHTMAVETVFEAQIALNEIFTLHRVRGVIIGFQGRLDGYEGLAIRKYEVGEGNQQSVLKLQLERARLDQNLLAINKAIEANTLAIARLVQQPVKLEIPQPPLVGAQPDEIDFDSRSDLRVLEKSRELASARNDLLNYYNRPDFAVKLNWMGIVASEMPGASDGRDVFAVGLGIRIPIGQAGNRARVQENELQIQAIDEQLESSKRTIEALFLEVQTRNEFDRALIAHIESSLLPSVGALLETSVASYSNGQGDLLDLLDSERSRFQLEKEKVDILGRLGEGQIMLDRISGRLNRLVSEQF